MGYPSSIAFCSAPAVPIRSNSSPRSLLFSHARPFTPLFPLPRRPRRRFIAGVPRVATHLSLDSSSSSDANESDADSESLSSPPLIKQGLQLSRRLFLLHLLSLPLFTSALAETTSLTAESVPSVSPPPPPPPPPPPAPSATPAKLKWSYTTPTGPASWADLSPDYATAATGLNQSPIPLSYKSAVTSTADGKRPVFTSVPSTFTFRLKDIPAAQNPVLQLDQYIPPPPPVVGDAPPLDLPAPPRPPAFVNYNSVSYAFRSMHVHAGSSEHTIDNVIGLAEFHFVFDRRARSPPPPPPPPPSSPPSTSSSSDSSSSTVTTTTTNTTTTPSSSSTSSSSPPPIGTTNGQSQSSSSSSSTPSSNASTKSAVSDTNSSVTDQTIAPQALSFASPSSSASSSSFGVPAAIAADADKDKPQILVVALLAKKGEESEEWIGKLLTPLISKAGPDGRGPGILVDMDLGTMLKNFDSTDLFVYSGSLTTPPCTENVTWVVMRSKCAISLDDVQTITSLQNGVNVRPLQAVNDRKVMRYPRKS